MHGATQTLDASAVPMIQSLSDLYNSREVNQISSFHAVLKQLNTDELYNAYQDCVRGAPHRHTRGKRYFEGRTGVTSSGKVSNRYEEHLAVALYNASRTGRDLFLPNGEQLQIIDYQNPLKARQLVSMSFKE